MRASSTAAVVLIATLSVVGCSQSTSPSVPASAVTAPTSAQVGPGASYNATGSWHVKVTNPRFGFVGETDVFLTQDADGNLHASDAVGTLTFTRQGSGRTIVYQASDFEHHTSCDSNLSGPARLDTTNDSMQVNISGTDQSPQGCINVTYAWTLTKNPNP